MKAGMKHIEPILSASGIESLGTVVMGTVKGDLPAIGKNLCIMMLNGAGFDVIDLGVDTSEDEFIDAVEEHQARLLGMSRPSVYRRLDVLEGCRLAADVPLGLSRRVFERRLT